MIEKPYKIETSSNVVDALFAFLSDLWPGWDGYKDALDDPRTGSPRSRRLFCVTSTGGSFSLSEHVVRVAIALQFMTDATKLEETSSYAIRTLRDRVNALNNELFRDPTRIFYGARPRGVTWDISVDGVRPVWQCLINIDFELPITVPDNGGFLV